MAVIQRSRDIYGPYENCPHNPILSHRKLHRYPIQATGHADLFEDGRGNWWMVCLGIRILDTQELHNLGRETFLVPVRWEDGWPLAGDKGTIALEMNGPLPAPPEPVNFDIKADFSGKKPDPHWNYIRNPDLSRYSLKNGRLFLEGGAEGLSDMNPVFTGVRQQSFCVEALTSVSADLAPGSRAGITAYYNDSYHYDLALEREKEGLVVSLNRRIHDMEAVTFSVPIPAREGDVELRISADSCWYCFSYRLDGGDWRDCGRGMTAGLCTEGTHFKTFTGVFIGLFSTGGMASFGGFTLRNL
jgi:alpha-N-arabinofuranosidase